VANGSALKAVTHALESVIIGVSVGRAVMANCGQEVLQTYRLR
jgi:hypothetical protein